jgi:prephenate dehydrogenase
LRAVELGWRVTGWDPLAAHLEVARSRGAIAAVAGSLRDLADGSDVLVLAAPLDGTLAMLRELSDHPPAAELVIDVASVKAPVALAGASLRAFVGTHPVAGSERGGPQAADGRLFMGQTWTYDANAPEPARAAAARFVATLGAHAAPLGNEEHDLALALTSHLPQVVAVALGALLEERAGEREFALCGPGMRSMLRLASSRWSVWQSILEANSVPLAQEVRRLAAILNGIADALESGRPATLENHFTAAARAVVRLGQDRVTEAFGSSEADER